MMTALIQHGVSGCQRKLVGNSEAAAEGAARAYGAAKRAGLARIIK